MKKSEPTVYKKYFFKKPSQVGITQNFTQDHTELLRYIINDIFTEIIWQ